MDSILVTIKKMLGIDEDYEQFDIDIITAINSGFFSLMQLGIGPPEGFSISTKTDEWVDFIGDRTDLAAIKSFLFLKTKLIFDPPSSTSLIDAIERQIKEFEWRLKVQVENISEEVT